MATDNRSNRRDDRDDRDSSAPQPWNLHRIVKIQKLNGEVKEEWIQCGIAWPLKEREGFTFDLYFALPEGARMAIMPRPPKNGGAR
jgi:hypothetical protein